MTLRCACCGSTQIIDTHEVIVIGAGALTVETATGLQETDIDAIFVSGPVCGDLLGVRAWVEEIAIRFTRDFLRGSSYFLQIVDGYEWLSLRRWQTTMRARRSLIVASRFTRHQARACNKQQRRWKRRRFVQKLRRTA